MRAAPGLLGLGLVGGALLLSGCASGRVTLLNDEGVTSSGAVAVLDPKTGAERGQLTAGDTWTSLRAKVRARSSKTNFDRLTQYVPYAPRHYILYFSEGTTDLTPESVPILEALRKEVTEASDVQITGHTDTVGSSDSNDKLSYERAVEIRAALVKKGLPVANARVAGRGERELRVQTADGVNEPANRRVEVILR
jgi:outer membrane protein OmpA-like peptidoglycan-associated protein